MMMACSHVQSEEEKVCAHWLMLVMFFEDPLLPGRVSAGKKKTSLCCSWPVSQEWNIPPLSIVLSETIRSIKEVKDTTQRAMKAETES